ncbi:serine hydrolase [Alteromonas sp. KUL49]|uniref:serine hydrolase domain-containing protein n=1 Tax=Alteromonas sp. KUL49 TaxID=2480798 RepID=UPI00102EE53C|nr:serine hydrolase [Alteromonas sp. KUL49]TAP37337.1 class C beta-lactamase-related serine hydrolase [Alteromonas sp. KUL49]GEA12965.1 6-aminohexanoate-dimer hydrolase [Alteromonas sp. KUL49]
MKKLVTVAFILVVFTTSFRYFLGFFPWHLVAALDVATGLGAKLACSGYYISKQEEGQIIEDLASYSPATRLVALDFSEPNRVVADLKGLSVNSATYRPHTGCTLDVGDTRPLDNIVQSTHAIGAENWPKGSGTANIDLELQQLVSALLTEDNAGGLQTRALVVVKDGQLVAEAYANNIDASTPLLGWSMGKSLTAIMVGRFATLGTNIDMQQERLFGNWTNTRSNISLEDMLQMSSGLAFDETYAPGSDSTHMLFSAYSASDVALDSELAFDPGTHFSYSSGTTNMIARWLHDQLGGTQQTVDFLNNEIFHYAGVTTATFETDPSGVFVGSSYIYASARDWARLGWLMVNDGKINGVQLLDSNWVAQATSPNESDNYPQYGYQFWLNSDRNSPEPKLIWPALPQDAYFMMGNRKQVVMMLPSQNTVVVRLGWTSGDYPMEVQFSKILAELNQ